MSTDTWPSEQAITAAVAKMRNDPDARWHPVADWLEEQGIGLAEWHRIGARQEVAEKFDHHAIEVARAYMAEVSR